MAVPKTDLAAADGQIQQAQGAYQQAVDALAEREIERLRNAVDAAKGALATAVAKKESGQEQISSLIPAQKASAEAALKQAQVDLDKTMVRAGVGGTIAQFALRPGDVVNPLLRPAGILVPDDAGRVVFAGFNQIEAQVLKVGMVGEYDYSFYGRALRRAT